MLERQPLAETASSRGLDVAAAEGMLAQARETLHSVRKQRPKPHLDDKVNRFWAHCCG